MIIAGFDEDGFPLGIGRFKVGSDLVPGTFRPRDGYVEVSCGGKSHKSYADFDILCDGDVEWIETQSGHISELAVQGGQVNSYYYEKLYIGKVLHDGKLVIGKVQPKHGCLYIPKGLLELSIKENYLLLTDKNKSKGSLTNRIVSFFTKTLRQS